MASTITTWDAFLKERYLDNQVVEDLTHKSHKLLANTKKDEGFTGDGMPYPLIYGNPQGLGGTFSVAQTNATNISGAKFTLTSGDYFGVVDIGDKVIKASRNNPGAYLSNKTAEIDGLYTQCADDLEGFMFGNSGGSIGRRASASTNVITLSEPSQAGNFHVGMTVVASDADGSGSSDALRTGSTTVASVDVNAGTVTLTSAAAITSFADNDYLFRQSAFRGSTSVFIIHGLGSFIWPDSSPPAVYGMTRTADVTKLAGVRVPAAQLVGKNIQERLRLLGVYMTGRADGPGADEVYLNPEDWDALETNLMSQGTRALTDTNTRFGFKMLEMTLGGESAKIYSARKCPRGTAFALKQSSWCMMSMGPLFAPQNEDGLEMLRKASSTDYEFRLIMYPTYATNAPGWNGRVAV